VEEPLFAFSWIVIRRLEAQLQCEQVLPLIAQCYNQHMHTHIMVTYTNLK